MNRKSPKFIEMSNIIKNIFNKIKDKYPYSNPEPLRFWYELSSNPIKKRYNFYFFELTCFKYNNNIDIDLGIYIKDKSSTNTRIPISLCESSEEIEFKIKSEMNRMNKILLPKLKQ